MNLDFKNNQTNKYYFIISRKKSNDLSSIKLPIKGFHEEIMKTEDISTKVG